MLAVKRRVNLLRQKSTFDDDITEDQSTIFNSKFSLSKVNDLNDLMRLVIDSTDKSLDIPRIQKVIK